MSVSFFVTLLLSILMVALVKFNPFTGPVSIIFSPFNSIRQLIAVQQSAISDLPQIYDENYKLKQENSHLKVVVKKLSDSIDNQTAIQKVGERHWQITPVKLVHLDNLATFTGLDLTQVLPGQPLISGEVLLGLVTKVEPPVIVVSPLTAVDTKIEAQLEDGTHGRYILKNGFPTITNLDNDTAFSPRTTVFTLPTSMLPENLIIGQVSEVITNQASPIQEAKIQLDQSLSSAKDFFIITKP